MEWALKHVGTDTGTRLNGTFSHSTRQRRCRKCRRCCRCAVVVCRVRCAVCGASSSRALPLRPLPPYDGLEVRRRLSEAPPPAASPSVSPVPAHHRSLPTSPSGKRSPDRFIPPPAATLPPPSSPFAGRLPKICCRNSSSSLEILRGRARGGRSGGGVIRGGDQGEDKGNRDNR